MTQLPAYILAGGQSRRFGSDKARAIFHSQPLLRHVAAMLQPVASSITVVADRDGKYDDLGFRTRADREPGLGPLGGLDTALADLPTEHDWLLLCSCDALVIQPHWLTRLIASIDAGHDAVAFRGDRWQPMPALYARTAGPVIAHWLQRDERSMQTLLDHLHTVELPLPDDWPTRWQANTPRDLTDLDADRNRS